MTTLKDVEQDQMIRQNAESIRRNEEVLRRQAEALEKIRDHYFPRISLWKRVCGFSIKVVGVVTLATGVMEGVEWYWNTRITRKMAAESAAVAKRLFFHETNYAGASRCLGKAVELDGETARYRVALGYVRGFSVIADLFDLGRPLAPDERQRVDDILSDAVFLQEADPDQAMPYVLAAQAYGLRGEIALARESAERAVALEPENPQTYVTACVMSFLSRDIPGARARLAEAERLDPEFPLVLYWKGFFALNLDRDPASARQTADRLVALLPRFAPGHALKGVTLAAGEKPDFKAACASFERAIEISPRLTMAMVHLAEVRERMGNVALARLWLARALGEDPKCMKALIARAAMSGRAGDWTAGIDDLTAAIALAPFRADLYRERARMSGAAGRKAEMASDLAIAEEIENP